MKCTYQVDDTGHHGADGQCNNRAVKKYSGENHPNGEQRCRLHYYMDREAQLLEQIHQLESGVQLEPMPTDGTLESELHSFPEEEHDPDTDLSPQEQFYIDNGLTGPRERVYYQREHWDSDDELEQPLRHKDCPNAPFYPIVKECWG